MLEWFQSRPGRPGRFASRSGVLLTIPLIGFNPDRAAQAVSPANPTYLPRHSSLVSIPTGPPRPFRPPTLSLFFCPVTVSIPTGPPRPFRRYDTGVVLAALVGFNP